MKTILWLGLCLCASQFFAQGLPVGKIYFSAPEKMKQDTLWVACFSPQVPSRAMPPQKLKSFNRLVREHNGTLFEILSKHYRYPFELVPFDSIEHLQAIGKRYYLDVALMPKQMSKPEPEAMIPGFHKFSSINQMYNNLYAQFHYYFYIRDLQNGEAFVGEKFIGKLEAYQGMTSFLKQIKKELNE